MRANLKKARTSAGMTQQAVADRLGITLRYYQMLEAGTRIGDMALWDMLEEIFNVRQRELRDNHPDTADNPS